MLDPLPYYVHPAQRHRYAWSTAVLIQDCYARMVDGEVGHPASGGATHADPELPEAIPSAYEVAGRDDGVQYAAGRRRSGWWVTAEEELEDFPVGRHVAIDDLDARGRSRSRACEPVGWPALGRLHDDGLGEGGLRAIPEEQTEEGTNHSIREDFLSR